MLIKLLYVGKNLNILTIVLNVSKAFIKLALMLKYTIHSQENDRAFRIYIYIYIYMYVR